MYEKGRIILAKQNSVIIDPGHGGSDGGAAANGLVEKNLTLKIAQYCKEELEKLEREKYVVERKLTAAMHKEKRLQSELKRLTRSERTHRLCTRAGMLEIFLKEPTVLTDEDVMEPLTFIFQSEAVQKKLNLLIESRRETQEADEGENP